MVSGADPAVTGGEALTDIRPTTTATTHGPAPAPSDPPGFLPRGGLERLINMLRADGRLVIGPTVEDGAIV